jgi:hypothetical protein
MLRNVQFVDRIVLARGLDCLSMKATNFLPELAWPEQRCLRYHHDGNLNIFVATVGTAMNALFGCTG